MDTPTLPRVIVAKSRLTPASWEKRVANARAAEEIVKSIAERCAQGVSLNQAIREKVSSSRRGWAMHHWVAYRRDGFEGLINARLPREPKRMRACEEAVAVARLANPQVTVAQMLSILAQRRILPLPSESTLRRLFRRVDDRRRDAKRKPRSKPSRVELPMAGGELLLAAEEETKMLATLTREVVDVSREVVEACGEQTPTRDRGPRDARGRFTADYNRQRRRKPGEVIASYLRSAQEKAEGQVLSGLSVVHEQPATVEAKIRMLAFEPLVNPTHGWNGLRTQSVQGLEPLMGSAYMPSTLAKCTAELARCNAGSRMLHALGEQAHHVAQERWGEAGAMAAFYIDNHAKEVWSSLYTQSGKVSHRNRVMPCLTTTYIHSGAGVPLLAVVQSGSAPLAPRVVELVKQQEQQLGDGVHRAVVIDSEGSTFDLLETFRREQRVIVTPLKPSRIAEVELSYPPGSSFRPYREEGALRIATAVLHHKTTNRSLELNALIVRRKHRESDTILLTTGISLGMSGRNLADLYYLRWPIQENAFKEGEAVRLAEHRGNGGTLVSNLVVVTKLDRLERQANTARKTLRRLGDEREALARAHQEREQAEHTLVACQNQLAELAENKPMNWAVLDQDMQAHQQAYRHDQACAHALKKAESKEAANEARRAKVTRDLERIVETTKALEGQKTIRKLDVALDSVLTAFKLAAAFLITFALREYLGSKTMTAATFVARVLSIQGRRELDSGEERIVFYENPRDPEINAVLAKACTRLNKRNLQRKGRRLCYRIEAVPKNPP